MPKKLSSKEGGRGSSFYCEWRPGGEPHFSSSFSLAWGLVLGFPFYGGGGDDIHFDSFISVLFAQMRFKCRKGERYSHN